MKRAGSVGDPDTAPATSSSSWRKKAETPAANSNSASPATAPKRATTGAKTDETSPQPCNSTSGRADIGDKELQSALHYAVFKAADEVVEEEKRDDEEDMEFEPEMIASVARLVWDTTIEHWGRDLAAFARHANRVTIGAEDVRLLLRRNDNLLATVERESGLATVRADQNDDSGDLPYDTSELPYDADQEEPGPSTVKRNKTTTNASGRRGRPRKSNDGAETRRRSSEESAQSASMLRFVERGKKTADREEEEKEKEERETEEKEREEREREEIERDEKERDEEKEQRATSYLKPLAQSTPLETPRPSQGGELRRRIPLCLPSPIAECLVNEMNTDDPFSLDPTEGENMLSRAVVESRRKGNARKERLEILREEATTSPKGDCSTKGSAESMHESIVLHELLGDDRVANEEEEEKKKKKKEDLKPEASIKAPTNADEYDSFDDEVVFVKRDERASKGKRANVNKEVREQEEAWKPLTQQAANQDPPDNADHSDSFYDEVIFVPCGNNVDKRENPSVSEVRNDETEWTKRYANDDGEDLAAVSDIFQTSETGRISVADESKTTSECILEAGVQRKSTSVRERRKPGDPDYDSFYDDSDDDFGAVLPKSVVVEQASCSKNEVQREVRKKESSNAKEEDGGGEQSGKAAVSSIRKRRSSTATATVRIKRKPGDPDYDSFYDDSDDEPPNEVVKAGEPKGSPEQQRNAGAVKQEVCYDDDVIVVSPYKNDTRAGNSRSRVLEMKTFSSSKDTVASSSKPTIAATAVAQKPAKKKMKFAEDIFGLGEEEEGEEDASVSVVPETPCPRRPTRAASSIRPGTSGANSLGRRMEDKNKKSKEETPRSGGQLSNFSAFSFDAE